MVIGTRPSLSELLKKKSLEERQLEASDLLAKSLIILLIMTNNMIQTEKNEFVDFIQSKGNDLLNAWCTLGKTLTEN